MRSTPPLLHRALAALAIVLGSGCAGGGTPGCIAIPVAPIVPSLAAPVPGSTGVSTGPLDITIRQAFYTTSVFVKDPSDNAIATTALRPASPPADGARVGTVAQLLPRTVYRVYADGRTPPRPCDSGSGSAEEQVLLLGSFTTR